MWLALEPVDEGIGNVAAAIIADIKNHRVLAEDVFVRFALETGFVGGTHGGNVEIANFAFAGGFHRAAGGRYLILISQISPIRLRHKLVTHLAAAGFLWLVIYQQLNDAILPGIEQAVHSLVRVDHRAVDRNNKLACFDMRFFKRPRCALGHGFDFQAQPAVGVVDREPEVRGGGFWGVRWGDDFRVRCLQLAHHHLQ